MKLKYAILFAVILSVLTIAPNIVVAATSSQLRLCEYAGVLRTLKIFGIALNIVKIVVPLVIIGTTMVTMFKGVTSGKAEDLSGSFATLVKRVIAGLIIFVLPTALDFTFDTLLEFDDTAFTACSNCFLDVDSCVIPDSDPDTYEED